MMHNSPLQSLDRTGPMATGWLVSCLLHGSLAFGAVFFVQRMELAPQAEPFKWNVALVESSSTMPPPDPDISAPPDQARTASTPAPPQTASSARAAESAPEPTHTSVESPAPSPPLVPAVAEKPAPTMPPLPPPPIAELSSDPLREQNPVPQAKEAPDQSSKQADPIEPSAPSVAPSPHPIQTSSPVQSPNVAVIPPHDSTSTVAAIASPTLDPPSRHASLTATEQIPSAKIEPPAVIKEAQSVPLSTATSTSRSQVAALAPTAQPNPSKMDYGWLADLMAGWIQELNKRYPAVLRTEGIEGRVTLTALLHDDGKLSDVRVAKSSGNAMLDQVAVEDVTKGPPVTLSRPLERPHMTVKFSIIYALKMVR